jgi:hypothetical protein
VIIDLLFPNFIFTTVLDVDFDSTSQKTHYEKKYKILGRQKFRDEDEYDANSHDKIMGVHKKPDIPPFMRGLKRKSKKSKSTNETNLMVDAALDKKPVSHAIGVKLNQTYSSEAASENKPTNRYDNLAERRKTPPKAIGENERIQKVLKFETNGSSAQEGHATASENKTIRL